MADAVTLDSVAAGLITTNLDEASRRSTRPPHGDRAANATVLLMGRLLAYTLK